MPGYLSDYYVPTQGKIPLGAWRLIDTYAVIIIAIDRSM